MNVGTMKVAFSLWFSGSLGMLLNQIEFGIIDDLRIFSRVLDYFQAMTGAKNNIACMFIISRVTNV